MYSKNAKKLSRVTDRHSSTMVLLFNAILHVHFITKAVHVYNREWVDSSNVVATCT